MTRCVVIGAGRIGRAIVGLLDEARDYELTVVDTNPRALAAIGISHPRVAVQQCFVEDSEALSSLLQGQEIVISAVGFTQTAKIAHAALVAGASYFDLTEDRTASSAIQSLAARAQSGQVFVPQCGLAPGFVSIATQHLTRSFDRVDSIRLRAGALSQHPVGRLGYYLTWSPEGLINQCCNPCAAIHQGRHVELLALEGREEFTLEGNAYEAFNTSGGIGTMCETWFGRVRELSYHSIRYPGHLDQMRFLLHDLRLEERRDLLRDIFEHAVPQTVEDVVLVFCTVVGWSDERLQERSYLRAFYPQTIAGETWTAIQSTTSLSVCAVVDLMRTATVPRTGLIRQEEIDFDAFKANRFGVRMTGTPDEDECVVDSLRRAATRDSDEKSVARQSMRADLPKSP